MARALLTPPLAIPSSNSDQVVALLSEDVAIPNRPYTGLLSESLALPNTDGKTNAIFQGDTGAEIRVESGYKITIEMALDGVKDSRGIMQWEDQGLEYDQYESTFSCRGLTPSALETMLASDSEENYMISTPVENGFYPFGMGFATNQNFPVSFYGDYKGEDIDVFGKLRKYKLKATPAIVGNIYDTFEEATSIADCGRIINGWQINGIQFPFASWDQQNNDSKKIIRTGGGSSEVVGTTRTYGDIAKIKITVAEEQARRILQFLTKSFRGTEKNATFPEIYNIFGRRHYGLTSATVKMFSEVITVVHVKPSIVAIEFTLQMVGI